MQLLDAFNYEQPKRLRVTLFTHSLRTENIQTHTARPVIFTELLSVQTVKVRIVFHAGLLFCLFCFYYRRRRGK